MTLTDRVEQLFRQRPGEWIDGLEVAKHGGMYASRSRISDCRLERGMAIENRQRRVVHPSGVVYTVSEYRFAPRSEAAWSQGCC